MTENLTGIELQGEIIRLAFGGMGIMRHEGLVVFVPFTAPGDHVKVKIRKFKKKFAEAELVEVTHPSESRTQPLCPYFGRCGGCQLQHLKYEMQVDQKLHFVEDALTRIGKIQLTKPAKIVPTDKPWAYRRHIRLTLFTQDNTYRVGYVGIDDKELVSVNQCPIFVKPDHPIVDLVSQLVTELTYEEGLRAHVSIIKDGKGSFVLFFDFPGHIPDNIDNVLKLAVNNDSSIIGAVWRGSDRGSTYGKTDCQLTIGGLTITYSPKAFVQSHPEQSAHIYHQIEMLVKEHSAKKVLDLYCGIGVTSLLLAKQGVQTIGIEANAEAITLAKKNADANKCPKAVFVRGEVAKVIRQTLKEHNFDLVVLNPPRIGSDPVTLKAIVDAAPKHIIYVSCMPATLARDLTVLCQKGYQVQECKGYDMFPQTTHVETLVMLSKQI